MKNKLLIDVGSSTVKVYRLTAQQSMKLIETKSFHFKQDFDPNVGLTESNKEALIDYIKALQAAHHKATVKVYATALFRKLTTKARSAFVDEFFRRTGLYFNIISHDLENHYLEMALAGKYDKDEPLLLINIGGGSTELVVVEHSKPVERHNLELGVVTVRADFPYINEPLSPHPAREVINTIRGELPQSSYQTQFAIYNGGELTYMQLAGYKLHPNRVLADAEHPYVISVEDFAARNAEVFQQVELFELERLMPNDPLWMHGARACSAIAQAVAEHFRVEQIIPSDSNMVHGIVRQELRSVVLSGSFRKHLDYILSVKKELSAAGTTILSPRFEEPKNPGDEFVVFEGEEGLSPLELERYHLDMLDQADALVVCSPNGYVGASALIEIGYAQSLGKRIIFTEKPVEFMLNTLPAEVGL